MLFTGGSSTATDQLELSAPCPEPDHPAITKMEEKLLAARKQVSGTPLLMGAEDLEDLQNEPPPLVSGEHIPRSHCGVTLSVCVAKYGSGVYAYMYVWNRASSGLAL